MAYEQYLKHSKNHRKDRFHQQCGFSFDERVESYASIAERNATSFHVRDMKTGEVLSKNFENADSAVDFVRSIKDRWCGVFTDKGMCLMK